MAKRRKKRHIGGIVFLSILVVGALVLFLGRHAIIDGIKTKAAKTVAKKLMEEQLKNSSIGDIDVSGIIDNMDDADVDTITDIAGKYVDPANIDQYVDMVKNGDLSGIKDQVQGQLTEEDKQQLQGLYDKYKDQIPSDFSPEDIPLE